FYAWYKRHVLWRTLKDPAISGESIYYLAADPALAGVSGRYFNLTHQEKPAPHALDRKAGRIVWEKTLRMTGASDEV
ncbi:MAG: short-chain dehydrogenase, partial [bacterium]